MKSAKHQEITAPLTLDPPGEGRFTLEHDRAAVAPVLKHVLRAKLVKLLEQGELVNYRILFNQQRARLRGLPAEPRSILSLPTSCRHEAIWPYPNFQGILSETLRVFGLYSLHPRNAGTGLIITRYWCQNTKIGFSSGVKTFLGFSDIL